jgi:hypothetical protein
MTRLKEGEKALHGVLPVSAAPPLSAAGPASQFMEDLTALDLNLITPLQALNFINTWKALIDGKDIKPTAKKAIRQPIKDSDKTPSLFEF